MKNTIIYLPHCSECGELIHGEVSCHEHGADLINLVWTSPYIYPSVCPNCGRYLESIVMPHPNSNNFSINMDEYLDCEVGSK